MKKENSIHLYLIKCLTNTHPGAGDTSFGIVDNLVQRDHLTSFPCIYSSSLKGAIREFFSFELSGGSYKEIADQVLDFIFGSDYNSGKFNAGKYIFEEASLVSIPIRSDKALFVNATCPSIINQLYDRLCMYSDFTKDTNESQKSSEEIENGKKPKKVHEALSLSKELFELKQKVKAAPKGITAIDNLDLVGATLEDFEFAVVYNLEGISQVIKNLFGERIVIVPDEKFKDLAAKLPIIARNKLLNGQSENLFYEEVLPRETRFFTSIIARQSNDEISYSENGKKEAFVDIFRQFLEHLDYVQIGANASIGYGKCKFLNISSFFK